MGFRNQVTRDQVAIDVAGFTNPIKARTDLLPNDPASEAVVNAHTSGRTSRVVAGGEIDTGILGVQGGLHGYQFLSRFYWPCISGEEFAPIMGGGTPAAYSQLRGRPAITTSNGNALWPIVPRVSPFDNTEEIAVVEWDFADQASNDPPAGGEQRFGMGQMNVGNPAERAIRVFRQDGAAPRNWFLETCDAVNVETRDTGILYDGTSVFHRFTLRISDIAVELSIDGVVVATNVVRLWPADASEPFEFRFLSGVSQPFITNLRLGWEA